MYLSEAVDTILVYYSRRGDNSFLILAVIESDFFVACWLANFHMTWNFHLIFKTFRGNRYKDDVTFDELRETICERGFLWAVWFTKRMSSSAEPG